MKQLTSCVDLFTQSKTNIMFMHVRFNNFLICCLYNGLLSQLPQRVVDTVAIKQQLLSQYDTLQSRLKGLKEAAEKEVSSHASWNCYLVISSGEAFI